MASIGLITKMVKMVYKAYPNSFIIKNENDLKEVVDMWALALDDDYPDNEVLVAFKEAVRTVTNNSGVQPGMLVDICNRMNEPDANETWDKFAAAMDKAQYHVYNLRSSEPYRSEAQNMLKKIFGNLPEEVQNYCGSVNVFVGLVKDCDRDRERNKFQREFPNLTKKVKVKKDLNTLEGLKICRLN